MNLNQNLVGEKELKGLENLGSTVIRCSKCFEELIHCQIVAKHEIKTRIKVLCEYCSNENESTVVGQFYLGAANDNMIFEIDNKEYEDCDVRVTTKRKNHGNNN